MTLTRQQVFDKAYLGLAAQGFQPSIRKNAGCRYRGTGGLKCAIGHCIPDELYHAEMEGKRISSGLVRKYLLGLFAADDDTFLQHLQACHDEAGDAYYMQNMLHRFAKDWGLTVPVVTP